MDFWLNWFRIVFKGIDFRRVRKISKPITNFVMSVLPSVFSSISLSVHMEQLSSQLTDFHEIRYLSIFKKAAEKFNFHQNLTRIMNTSYEDLCTYIYDIISLNYS